MIISQLLKNGIDKLKNSNIKNPQFVASVLLCHVLNCEKHFIYAHGEKVVLKENVGLYLSMLELIISGKPLQHITRHQEFMSLDFVVSSDVLIPRQDTEILVEAIINYSREIGSRQINILDLGTGSGCIAISLAHYIKNAKVIGVDISEEALKIAKENAVKLNTSDRVEFYLSDLFEVLDEDKIYAHNFDIIVSNPPYIPTGDIVDLPRDVKEYEPFIALDGGVDGIDFYNKICEESIKFLTSKGLLAFEVGVDEAKAVCGIMKKNFSNIRVIKDLSGIERVVLGKKNY